MPENCPFCGKKPGYSKRNMQMVCMNCGCTGPVKETQEEAVDAWNHRNIGNTDIYENSESIEQYPSLEAAIIDGRDIVDEPLEPGEVALVRHWKDIGTRYYVFVPKEKVPNPDEENYEANLAQYHDNCEIKGFKTLAGAEQFAATLNMMREDF